MSYTYELNLMYLVATEAKTTIIYFFTYFLTKILFKVRKTTRYGLTEKQKNNRHYKTLQ